MIKTKLVRVQEANALITSRS